MSPIILVSSSSPARVNGPPPKKLDAGTLSAIGKKAVRLYKEAHDGEAPPKHVQYVDGAARHVNSYTSDDVGVLKQAILHVLE